MAAEGVGVNGVQTNGRVRGGARVPRQQSRRIAPERPREVEADSASPALREHRRPAARVAGDCRAGIEDAWKNQWWIATHVEPDELERREREFREPRGLK